MKAWRLMHETYGIGNVRMHLHKAVPSGPASEEGRRTERRRCAC